MARLKRGPKLLDTSEDLDKIGAEDSPVDESMGA